MPSLSQARQASFESSRVQQPREPVRRVPGMRLRARCTPTTSCPASTARAAATAESTPPLIAARTFTEASYRPCPESAWRLVAERGGAVGETRSRRPLDRGGQGSEQCVDVGLCRGVTEGEPQRAARLFFTQTHAEQHVARLGNPRLARRTRAHRDTRRVEQEQQRIAFAAGK